VIDQLLGGERSTFALQVVHAVGVKLAARGVQRDCEIRARLVSGRLDRRNEQLEWRFVGAQLRSEAALVPDAGAEPL
jgi:hypothetical protein